jgi:copper(I)-binding protein
MNRRTIARCAGLVAVASIFLIGSALALAESGVKVTNVWAKSTAPGQTVAAAYLDIVSSAPAALVRAESPAAKTVELHEMKMDGDVMRMRAVQRIELPAGKTVRLEPGGLHVMLVDIEQPLKAGGAIPLTLVVESEGKTETLKTTAEVRDSKGGDHHH